MKNYFYFLMEWAETFKALTDPQCGRLIKAMVEFERTGAAPSFEDDALLHFAWVTNIMPKMMTMQEHYRETIAKRSMAGKASATKRTSVNKSEQVLTSVNTMEQNEQKPTDIDLDLDIDIDLVNKKEKIDRKEKPVKHQCVPANLWGTHFEAFAVPHLKAVHCYKFRIDVSLAFLFYISFLFY